MSYLKDRPNKGFTLLEALIAITIVSILGLALFSVVPNILSFSEKVKAVNRWNGELIRLEMVLRRSINEIQIPYWVDEIKTEQSEQSIKLPFWQADPELFLHIFIENNTLFIRTPEKKYQYQQYDGLVISELKNSSGKEIGITLNLHKMHRDTISFQCTFGAIGSSVFRESVQ